MYQAECLHSSKVIYAKRNIKGKVHFPSYENSDRGNDNLQNQYANIVSTVKYVIYLQTLISCKLIVIFWQLVSKVPHQ
jgi:hypothetical protein